MGTLTLYIRGLAVCHFEDTKVWKVYFPNVKEHYFEIIVKATIGVGSDRTIRITKYKPLPSSKISILAKGSEGSSEEGNLEDLINISTLISKDNNPVKNPISLKTDSSNYSALLSLYGFKLNQSSFDLELPDYNFPVVENRSHDYNVWHLLEATENCPFTHKKQLENISVKDSIKSDEISMSNNEKTLISIENVFDDFLIHSENVTYEILLNNSCDKSPTECESLTDFKFYYDIFEKTNIENIELLRIEQPTGGYRTGCDVVIKKP
jgi:hypothetical protein